MMGLLMGTRYRLGDRGLSIDVRTRKVSSLAGVIFITFLLRIKIKLYKT